MKIIKKITRISLILISIVIALVLIANILVIRTTKDRVFHEVNQLPVNDVALVLGTSKFSRSGKTNLFFKYRMDAAYELYKQNKARFFIASGDNSLSYYNEPQDMKKALVLKGIPAENITLDYAGFRTFDSVVRSKKIFGQDSITIITQNFHCYRALFISDYYGMKAVAFAAGGVPEGHSSYTYFREYLARFKAVLDVYILKKEPKFLGDSIEINKPE